MDIQTAAAIADDVTQALAKVFPDLPGKQVIQSGTVRRLQQMVQSASPSTAARIFISVGNVKSRALYTSVSVNGSLDTLAVQFSWPRQRNSTKELKLPLQPGVERTVVKEFEQYLEQKKMASDLNLIHRVALIQRVATNHTVAARMVGNWDGKLVGDSYRLQWDRNLFLLEELPAKGKKKLQVCRFQVPGYSGGASFMIPQNLFRDAKLDKNDSVDEVMKKMKKAWNTGVDAAEEGKYGDRDKQYIADTSSYIRKVDWTKGTVHFLEVEPEGVEPFMIEAKDFSLKVSWTDFESYSPQSDFQQSDPHYTKYSAKSPAAARKLYKLLKTDSKALKDMPWSKFGEWLNSEGIAYRSNSSSW